MFGGDLANAEKRGQTILGVLAQWEESSQELGDSQIGHKRAESTMRPERLGVLTRRHTAGKLPPGDSGQNPRLQQRMSRSVVARVLSAPEALGSMPSTSLTNKQKKPNLITLPDPTKKTPSNGLKKKKSTKE